MERIYLDHAATSPMDERVLEKMIPHFSGSFGNPSSIHSFGRESRKWVDEARAQIAAEIGAAEQEIIFTSGERKLITWRSWVPHLQEKILADISSQQKLSITPCFTHVKNLRETDLT